MKPTPTINDSHHQSSRWDTPQGRIGRGIPSTDYCFKPTARSLGTGGSSRESPVQVRNFRDLSRDFLGSETSRSYVREAGLFVLITAVSAWPIISMIRAIGRL
jgi:hypothetical protein